MYDTVIVGGGIAGLTVAHELSRRGIQTVVLERYPAFGGRIATHRDNGLQYEIGAGRLFVHHARVAELVKRYKLHTFSIKTHSVYEGVANPFLDLFAPIRRSALTCTDLGQHTIGDIIPSSMADVLTMYPYTAEIHTLRSDLALAEFASSETMGVRGTDDYYGIVEGIDAITSHLADDATAAGAILKSRHRVTDIQRKDDLFEITGNRGKKAHAKPFRIVARRIIIATARPSYDAFSVLRDAPFLQHLATSPLMRVYAVYPKDPITNAVWFAGMSKIVTKNRLRYIIPINAESGLIMISYTDGKDTDYWRSHADDLQATLHRELMQVFPTAQIPEPTYVKMHDWADGCTYWLPGTYDVAAMSAAAHNPSPNLYVCGESISMNQAWIEGALESATHVIDRIFKN